LLFPRYEDKIISLGKLKININGKDKREVIPFSGMCPRAFDN